MQRRSAWLFVAVAAVVLAAAIVREAWPWISDDAFISLRYAERLLAGKGLTWNDGEYVEGYSNLSWVLLSSLLGWLGLDLVTAVRVLGIASTLGSCALLAFGFLRRLPLPAGLATVLLAAQPTVVLWSIGGLEAPLAMLCVGGGLWGGWRGLAAGSAAERRRAGAIGGAFHSLLVLTRPDAPLWVVAAVVMVLVCRPPATERLRERLPLALLLAVPPLAVWLLQTGFRWWYFGDWVANTTRAKLAPSLAAWQTGLDYLRSAAEALRSLWIPALLGAWFASRDRAARPLVVYAAFVLPIWVLYIGSIGGDYFPRNRVLVPALIPLAVLAAHAIAGAHRGGGRRPLLAWSLAIGSIGLARFDGEWLPHQPVPPPRLPRQGLSWWEWKGIAAGKWLAEAFGDRQPLLAVDQVGALPFASRLRCLDMLGLCDRTIAMTPIEPERRWMIGHARGNGPYVLSRRPDYVGFLPPPHSPAPTYASGAQMEQDPAFLDGYRLVRFDVDRFDRRRCNMGPDEVLVLHCWLALDGVLGHGPWQGDRLVVPGWLLGSYRQPYAFHLAGAHPVPGMEEYPQWARDVDAGFRWLARRGWLGVLDRERGMVVGEAREPGEYALPGLELPVGGIRVLPAPLPPSVTFRLELDGAPLARQDDVWRVPAGTGATRRVDVVCTVPETTPLPLRLRELVLERVAERR